MISRDQFQSKILEPILSSEVTNNSNVHKKNGKILAILTGPLRDKIIERPNDAPIIDSSVLIPGEIVNYNISPYSVDAIVISKNKEGELEESGTLVPDNIITLGALLTELGLKDHNYNMEMQENPIKTPAIIVSGGGSSTQVMINGVENLNELIANLSSQLKIRPGTEFNQDLFFGSIGSLTNPVNSEIVDTAIQRLKVIAAFLDIPVIFFIGNFGRLFINDSSAHPILLPGEIPEGLKPFEAPNKFDKRNNLLELINTSLSENYVLTPEQLTVLKRDPNATKAVFVPRNSPDVVGKPGIGALKEYNRIGQYYDTCIELSSTGATTYIQDETGIRRVPSGENKNSNNVYNGEKLMKILSSRSLGGKSRRNKSRTGRKGRTRKGIKTRKRRRSRIRRNRF
jgi:hypothetical protein